MSPAGRGPIDSATARRWGAFVRGPKEQWLRCEGSLTARAVSWLHFRWPFARGQWRFNQILRKAAFLAPRLHGVPFSSECGVRVVLDVPSDEFLHLSGRLSSEPLELAVMSRIVRPGDTFLDVGAHRGLYILHVLGTLGKDGTYHAFEPSPTNFAFLQRAFPEAGPKLNCWKLAISDTNGESSLADEGSLTAHLGAAGKGSVRVATARMDSILSKAQLSEGAVIMKLDTEGHDAAALRGCKGLGASGVRPLILTEFLPSIFGQTRSQVMDAITQSFGTGYRFLAIDSAAGRLTEFTLADEAREDIRNILALPPEHGSRISGCFQ